MSYCTTDILLLASGIYQTLGSPTNTSVGYISGWITTSGNLGDLTNKLNTSFYLSGSSPCIVNMGPQEAAVYQIVFSSEYFESQSLNVLAAGGTFWTHLVEGDSKISRASPHEISKAYLKLYESSNRKLRIAIQDYKRDKSSVLTVDYSDLPSYPQS